MKANQIIDALGEVEEEKIEKATRKKLNDKKPRKNNKRFIALVASFVLIFASYGLLTRKVNNNDIYALAKASYPSISDYPKEEEYFNEKTGEFDPSYDEKYEKWKSDQVKLEVKNQDYDIKYKDFLRNNLESFFQEVKDERVFSPLNFYLASSMLTELVDGQTRDELSSLLEEPSMESLRENTRELWLTNYQDDGRYSSILANSIWLKEGENYNKELLDLLGENYYASIFAGDVYDPNYSKKFRQWIDESTKGILKDMTKDQRINPDTVVKLVSTIYFNDEWQDEFYEEQTQLDTFYSPFGDLERSFMNQILDNHKYYRGDGFSAVNKSLKEAGSVWFILPNKDKNPEDIIGSKDLLDMVLEEEEYKNKKDYKINLSLPRFDVKSDLDLIPILRQNGINKVFNPGEANFSPLGEFDNPLYVSEFKHAARVKIDEKSVTAAAYTVIEIKEESKMLDEIEEIDFIVNRPFIFIINNRQGLPIFTGIIKTISD